MAGASDVRVARQNWAFHAVDWVSAHVIKALSENWGRYHPMLAVIDLQDAHSDRRAVDRGHDTHVIAAIMTPLEFQLALKHTIKLTPKQLATRIKKARRASETIRRDVATEKARKHWNTCQQTTPITDCKVGISNLHIAPCGSTLREIKHFRHIDSDNAPASLHERHGNQSLRGQKRWVFDVRVGRNWLILRGKISVTQWLEHFTQGWSISQMGN